MKNKNPFLRLASLIITMIAIAGISFAGYGPDKIKCKAVYSDDLTPVRGGTIEVVSTAMPSIGNIVIEKVRIENGGTFSLSKGLLNQTDDIKIMAYPNDVDGAVLDFEPAEFKLENVIVQTKEDYTLLIKVNRASGTVGTEKNK